MEWYKGDMTCFREIIALYRAEGCNIIAYRILYIFVIEANIYIFRSTIQCKRNLVKYPPSMALITITFLWIDWMRNLIIGNKQQTNPKANSHLEKKNTNE